MLWLLAFLAILLFHSELLYASLRISRLMPPEIQMKEVIEAEVLTRSRLKVFIVSDLAIETLSLTYFWQPRILIEKSLWDELNGEQRGLLILWLSLSAKFQSAGLRIILGSHLFRIDRDLCVIAKGSLEWAPVLKRLYERRAQRPPTSFGAILAGLSAIGPGLIHQTLYPGDRLKALAQQLTKLRK